jgi:polar amino acid transport system permease protein
MFEPGTFWHAVWVARAGLLEGLAITASASGLVILIGLALGLVFGLTLSFGPRPVQLGIRGYIELVRGIPVLVLILFVFYGLSLAGINIRAFWAGVIALSAFCTAHMAETVRGAVQSVPRAQMEAAKSIGLRFSQVIRLVVVPLAIRRVLPPSVNTAAEIVKGTTLLSIIGVVELQLATQQVIARTYMVLPFFALALALYFSVTFLLSLLAGYFERRFAYLRY